MNKGNMKPILFHTEMVRTILEGRKTVTRRLVKPQPKGAHTILGHDDEGRSFDLLCGNGGEGGVFLDWAETIKAPCWPGDILWVRETWAKSMVGTFMYRADDKAIMIERWHPSIHMPREAARIFLRVTNIRIEQLQDISYAETFDEGLSVYNVGILPYSRLWNRTIKPADRKIYGWKANPWVWVIEFERCEKPEGWPG